LAEGGSVTMDIDGHPHLLIDGAYKEGGGQVLRNTFSLSALLGRPIKAFNIRANRNRPGLMAQHLTGIRLVAEMFDGWLDGAEVREYYF
jgi:RNA 3'-terminal phosphate cyclase